MFTIENPCVCGAYGGPESHARWCRYAVGGEGGAAPQPDARAVMQQALDMLRAERYGSADPDKREQAIEAIEHYMKHAAVAHAAPPKEKK